ncbi:MAG TPA: helix-turn-helix transcriptional regulator [Tepidisphaeraceae bacterium]|nr:helix-turn-helix transcriptional regulator [Tepidisphaeraceae bacterium]
MADVQTLHLAGKEFVVIERREYERLARANGGDSLEAGLPPLPAPDEEGNVPAVAYGRALLARKLVLARRRAGLTQAELARRAKIRVETLNRLEKGRHNPDESTFNKIEAALKAAGVRV